MSRIVIPARIDYEHEHRPPRRTEHEHGKEARTDGGVGGEKCLFFSDDSLKRYNITAFQDFRPRATE
ncbi:MAG: hypothetical protein DWH99_17735 [Planctomycetota bacterium]|nr:MAG: hypothetical protein DWH99_17735 [Planctomycetota bacterium]